MTCPTAALRVLVGDDNQAVCEALRLVLKGAGHDAALAGSPSEILAELERAEYDVLLLDMNYTRDTTSGREGLKLLERIRARHASLPVVVMTAWGSIELAVEAMRRGAVDFVTKPWDNAAVVSVLAKHAGEARRHASEFDIAARVQRNLFPAAVVRMDGLECAGTCVAPGQVGGDYYDFLEPASFVLADVSGKGLGAALLMANLQALFRVQAGESIPVLLRAVNRLFHASTAPENYATAFYASWDERGRTLRYVNCGHPAALVVRRSGEVERLPSTATVLGLFLEWECDPTEVSLEEGDLVVVYSDGVTEATNASGQEFGEQRAATAATACRHRMPRDVAGAIVEAVRAHCGGDLDDDATVVVARAGRSGRSIAGER